jgi:hypothetical protein
MQDEKKAKLKLTNIKIYLLIFLNNFKKKNNIKNNIKNDKKINKFLIFNDSINKCFCVYILSM